MRSKKNGRHFGSFSRVLHQLFKQAGSPRQSRPRRFEKLDERTVFSAPAPIVFSFDTSYDGFAEVPGYTGGEYALIASDATASAPHSGAKFLRLRINDQNSARTNTLEQRMARNFDTRPGDTFFGWGIFDDNVNSATTPSVRRIRGQMELRDVATGTIAKSFWYQTERFDWNTDPGESPDSVDWSGLSKVTFRLDEQLPNFRDARFAIDDLTWSRPDNAVDDHFDVDAGGIAARNILANDRYVRLGADAVVTIGSELGEGQVGVPLRGKYGSLTIYSNGDAWYTADPLAYLAPWHPPLSDAFAPGVRDQITVGTANEIQNGFYNQQNLYVAIYGVNDAPTAQDLSERTVNENSPIGTIIGLFSTTDVDHDDSHTYSLVDGPGGQDNDSFEIVGSSLKTKVSMDFETKSSYSIRVRSTDRGGKWIERLYEITVKNVNDPPNAGADDSTITIREDSTYTFSQGDFLFTDPDAGDYMSGVRIDTLPSRGALRLAGNSVAPGQVIAAASIPALSFTPSQDENGLNYTSFTFSVIDAAGAADPTPARKSINVTAVNDPPVRIPPLSPIVVLEDSASIAPSSLFLDLPNYGPGGGSDEATQTISITFTSIPSFSKLYKSDGITEVTVNQTITLPEFRGLKYKTPPHANGSGLLTWNVTDNGGTANGGSDSTSDSLLFTILPVNDAPVRTAGNPSPISVLEDSANTTAVSLGLSSLNYGPGGGSDENTQTLTYTITAIPSAIQIFKADGTTGVLVNQTVSLLELQGLKYKTIPNANGSGSLTWTIKDNGGTANGGVDTITNSLSVTVTAVNDAPVRTAGNPSPISVLEDSANTTAVTLGLSSLNYGPGGGSDENTQTLSFTIVAIPSAIRVFKNDGTTQVTVQQSVTLLELQGLMYKTHPNAFGTGKLEWNVKDNGGTANGGKDTLRDFLSITVTSVNDAPTDITLTPNSIPENAAPNSTVGTLRSIDPDTGNTFSYALVAGLGDNDNSAFRISGSLLRTSQSFDYEAKSSYSIRVKSTDQGGLSTQKVLVINVTDVNDAPRFVDPEYEFEVADGTRQDNGSQANNGQWRPSISRDGRFVAFVSYATNLAANDFEMDVFVKDTFSGNVVEVSNTQSGGRSNGDSFNPTITPDGRFVVFESYASNLVPEDTSPTGDIFLRDLQTGTLERISTSSTGTAGNDRSYSPSVSDDGRFVAFRSDANNLVDGDTNGKGDIFIKDRLTGELSRVSNAFDGSQGNNHSFEPAISGDGNKVAFRSYASNLVAGTDNNFEDIYVKDLRTGTILRANTSTDGQQGNNAVWVPSLSYDGRFLSFPSTATNLVPGDTNAAWDVFLKDLNTGETTRVSTTVNGTQANGASNYATISGDGRYVTFLSSASNLVSDDTNGKEDVFIKDTLTGTITRVSTSSDRAQANDASSEAFVSAAGNLVAFTSTATNLVPNDTNGVPDIFIKNLITGETRLAVGNNSRVLIGQVSGTDQDANSVLRYTLTGPGADAFVINPITGQIELSSTGVMDFNLQPTYALTALVSDGVLSSTVPVTIHVTNGNNRPTDILLSSSSIEENMEENTLVGTLSVLDPNPGDVHIYQLVEGLGSDDNASFFIEGTNLRAVGSFDFETKSSYSIRIRATDQGDLFKEKIFTIRVTDVDEGFPLLGTTANDAFVATYTGDGIVHAWSVTRNGTLLFNGTLPNTSLLIDGLGGTDTLDVVGRSADDVIQLDGSQLFINTAKLRFPRIESIRIQAKEGNDTLTVTTALPSGVTGSFDGGVGLDRLEAVAGTNVWNVLGTDSGSLNSNLTFTATESIQGGANEDQFVLSALGKTTGKILGGGGIDMLSMAAKTLAHTINLQTNTATSTGGIGGIEYFIGSTSATVFDVLIGANSDTTWNIDGTDQGILSSAVTGTVAFTGFENLTGGTSRDSFVFSNAGRLTKTLTGGTATGVIDTVDLSEKTAALEFRLDGTSTSVPGSIGTYTGIEHLTGNNHANSKVSRSSNTTTMWTVDAFGNIVVLGATYANVPMIAGGPGTDTLTGPALASSTVQWIIDSANGGSISLPSIKTIAFSSINGLAGGTGDDVFEIRQAGSISSNLNGGTGAGINALSYSQWTSGVSVNLSVGTAANATAIGGITSNFQMVTGGSGDDSLRGNASKTTVLIGLAGNDSLVGGTQRDILAAGLGNDLLQGGNGDDLLISGRTSYDLNFDAMKGVLAEWTSTRTFAQRTANLWGNGTGTRSNSNYFLNSQPSDDITDTVFADTDNDSLSGGLNQDWFFASLNDLTDFTGTGTAPDRLDP